MQADLDVIRIQAGKEVEGQLLIHFTDHTLRHLDAVAHHFLDLERLSSGSQTGLSREELFCGLASCYLHDVALQSSVEVINKPVDEMTAEDYQQIRRAHGEQAYRRIVEDVKPTKDREDKKRDLGLNRSDAGRALAEVIATVCRHHTGSPNAIAKLPDAQTPDGPIRVSLLAHMLRVADGIDLDRTRVELQALDQRRISAESQVHWWRHHYVDRVQIDDKGRVETWLTFPEQMHRVLMDYFTNSVQDYIRRELEPAQDMFIDHGIHLHVSRPSASSDYAVLKRLPTRELQDFLAERGELDATRITAPPKPLGKKARHYLDAWNVTGNPWTDLPISIADKQFVLTQDLEEKLSEIEFLRQGAAGDLRLVYGSRGAGKTTFLKAVHEHYNGDHEAVIVDVTRASDLPMQAGPLFDWVFKELHTRATRSAPPRDIGPNEVQTILDALPGQSPVILIDNLDRQMPEPDHDVLRRFFQVAQGNLQALKRKAVVLISATTDWKDILNTQEFSYLGKSSYIELEPFDSAAARELLDRRLALAGSSYEKVFTHTVANRITQFAEGIPRSIILGAETLCDAAIRDGVNRIDAAFVEKELGSELALRRQRVIYRTANKTANNTDALQDIYRFYLAVDKVGVEDGLPWDIFQALFDSKGLDARRIPNDYTLSVSEIAEPSRRDDHRVTAWTMRPRVRRFLRDLIDGGLSLPDFVQAYQLRPLHGKPRKQPDTLPEPQGPRHVATALGEARRLVQEAAGLQNKPATAILKAHFAVEQALIALLRLKEVPLPPHVGESDEGFVEGVLGQKRRKPDRYLISEMVALRRSALDHGPRAIKADVFSVTERSLDYLRSHKKAEAFTEADWQAAVGAASSLYRRIQGIAEKTSC